MKKENNTDKEKKKTGIAKKILKIFIIVLLVPILVSAGLFINYLFTREKPEDVLASDFIMYLEIRSMGDIYENFMDLKAIEVFLTGQQKNDIFLALNNFKSGSLARHPFFKGILDIEAHLQILDNGKPVIVLNPGIRSIVTRLLPLINTFYKMPELNLNILQRNGKQVYEYPLNDKSSVYLYFHKNLIFISTDPETVLSLPQHKKDDKNLASLGKISRIKNKVREKGFLTCYLQMSKLMPFLLGEDSKEWQFINKQVVFPYLSVLTLDLSNEQLSLSFYSDLEYRSGFLMDALEKWKSGKLEASRYLPAETTVFTAYRFTSFLDIYSLFLSLQDGAYDEILAKAEKAGKALFDMGLEEILSWIGSEVGAFYLNRSTKPVLFMEIADKDRLDSFIRKLTASIFLKQEKDVLMNDEIVISQIGFPAFIQGIINHFVKGIEEPYYLVIDDYLFLSMDPEALYTVAKSVKDNTVITETENYQSITDSFPSEASIFLYFDLSKDMPGFLLRQPQIMSFMDYYQKGLVTFQITDKKIHLELSAVPIGEKKSGLYPGYPVHLVGDTKDDIVLVGRRNALPSIAYISNDNILRIADLSGKVKNETEVSGKSLLLAPENENTYSDMLYVLDNDEQLAGYDLNLDKMMTYEGVSNKTFKPVFYRNKLVYFRLDERTLHFLDLQSEDDSIFPFRMLKPVHVAPSFSDTAMAVYPKDIAGTVYLLNTDGDVFPGWPVNGGGISACGPVLYLQGEELNVIFLTQSGVLNVWDRSGKTVEGFPLDLGEVHYTSPVVFKNDKNLYIAAVSEKGRARIITSEGRILSENVFTGLGGKDIKITVFDSDNNGLDELYFYGSRDFIIRTDGFLAQSPGFPVNGYTRPLFIDLDGDGKKEMASVGLDNQLYLYTLEK